MEQMNKNSEPLKTTENGEKPKFVGINPEHLKVFEELSCADQIPEPPEVPPSTEPIKPMKPMIQLSTPVTYDDIKYVMEKYDYDPNDTVVNTFSDHEAEYFIREKIVEYRTQNGIPV